jgi:hypothetical protein
MGAEPARTHAAPPQRTEAQRPSLRSALSTPSAALTQLQRAVGNCAMHRMLRAAVQPKLTVGPADDEYEREADRVAESVMRMPAPPADGEDTIRPLIAPTASSVTRLLQREEEEDQEDEEAVSATGALQRLCTECQEEHDQQSETSQSPVQRASADEQREDDDEEASSARRQAAARAAREVSPALAAEISAMDGGGSPLPDSIRALFEPRFGADFSPVRIHTDPRAADAARSINARAFTLGPNIAFATGEYSPDSYSGKQIIAHELTHVLQQGAAASDAQIHRAPQRIQTIPQAGVIPPVTDKQSRHYSHRDDVVDIKGEATFKPGEGLGNYIASLWENGQEAPVNIRFGAMGAGYIFVKPKGKYVTERCLNLPVFGLLGPSISICEDVAPETENYQADLQTIPLQHDAFQRTDNGTLVLLVGIVNGFIFGKLAWIEGKTAAEIHPLAFQESPALFNEEVFLPLIYGDDYDGENYTSAEYHNELESGVISFLSSGTLQLPYQQTIEGKLGLVNSLHLWIGDLHGKAEGLDDYEFQVERTGDAELFGETTELTLSKEWTGGDPSAEDGVFTVQGQLRASYKNGVFSFFGQATYSSARVSGAVDIAITSRSEAQQLFAEHAPAAKVQAAASGAIAPEEGTADEPLALTAWGNLAFTLIDPQTTAKGTPAAGTAAKTALPPLEGEGAFVVSSDGYIILSGKLKLPTGWTFTERHKYQSSDPEARPDDPEKKDLFKKETTVARAPVPFGTVGLRLGITVNAEAEVAPLELYEIEVSGVYSNHPEYRSELNISPRFYISGYAAATVTVEAEGAYKLAGVFTIGEVTGSLTGTARAEAYIDAAPAVTTMWKGDDSPATYALSGVIHAGGKLTFDLTGNIKVDVLKAEIWKSSDYHIGSWTIGSFGIKLNLKEYVLGSGEVPQFDYTSIGFGAKQRQSLGDAIAREKEGAGGSAKRTGGFEQLEDGKKIETGTFSETEPVRPDVGAQDVSASLEEDFLMQETLHELRLKITGTRDRPSAELTMASNGEKPLADKIDQEQLKLATTKLVADEDTKEQIRQREADLAAIEREAKNVKEAAEDAAQKAEAGAEPVVAGFDRLDDRLSGYAQAHGVNDLGAPTPGATPAGPPPVLHVPKSNGASLEMEQRLAEKRLEVGYEEFDDFRGSNVAVFRYNVLKPGSKVTTPETLAGGPFYETAVNTSNRLHSEIIIAGKLQKLHQTKKFRKKYGPDYIIAVDQVLSERSPCSQCRGALEQPSTLISTSNYHNFYVVHYSGNWIERNRALMLRYGLQPPSLAELKKLYGRGDTDPH